MHGRNLMGTQGTCFPTFLDGGDNMCCAPPTFVSLGFVCGEVKKKSDFCHVLCEELFMLDVIQTAKLVLKQGLAWSVILIFFINFSSDKMCFGILQVSRGRERLLKLLLSDIFPCVVYCAKC